MTPTISRLRWLGIMAAGAVAVIAITAAPPGPDQGLTLRTTPIPDSPKPLPRTRAIGEIDRVEIEGPAVTITGWAVDLSNPDSTRVRITLDGEFVATVPATTSRPDVAVSHGLGPLHGFTTTLMLAPGGHSVCVFTAPDDRYVTCERVAGGDHPGVVITPTRVMVELLEVDGGRYRVRTPCGDEVTISKGKRVRTTQILIDPGHGGSETASVGPNGLGEKRLNLDVAVRTARALRERGFSVELTRTTDVRLPIATRAALANALDPDIFLSLHHNGGATARTPVPGTQVYTQNGDQEARRLGGILYEELFAAASDFPTAWVGNVLDGVSTRLNAVGTDFYGIHRRTPTVTSVITEFLWLSSGPEAALLARSEVRNAEAQAIATGIDRWYQTQNSGSGFLPSFVDTFDSGGGGFEGCVDPKLT